MNRDQIYSWVRETVEMCDVLNRVQESVDKIRAHIELSEAGGHTEQLSQLNQNLTTILPELDKIQAVLLKRTKVREPERLRQYVLDMQFRTENMTEMFEAWRKNVTQFEIMVEGDLIKDDETRKQSQALLDKYQHQYESAKKVIEQAIPSTVEIIRV